MKKNPKPLKTEASVYLWVEARKAQFTMPMLRADGTSYAVITPTSAIGLAKQIFSKPEMEWIVKRIVVGKPIRYATITRNFAQDKMNPEHNGMLLRTEEVIRESSAQVLKPNVQQSSTQVLMNVAYRIEYTIKLANDISEYPEGVDIHKYLNQIQERLRKGRCFAQPYLGCKEYVCSLIRESTIEESNYDFIPEELRNATIQLGRMPIFNYRTDTGAFKSFFKNVELVGGILDVENVY